MKGIIVLLGSIFALTAFSVSAKESFSYNYVQAAYFDQSPDNGHDFTGFEVGASGLVGPGLFVFGSYLDSGTKSFTVGSPPFSATGKFDFRQYKAGLGMHSPLAIAPSTDVRVAAAFLRQETRGKDGFSGIPDADGNGYEIGLGLRQWLLPQFEIDLAANYDNVADTNTHHTTGLGSALFYLTPIFSIVGTYSYSSDSDGWAVGGRLRF